jgi:hypothetical protein
LGCGGRHCENQETDAGSLRLWRLRSYLIVLCKRCKQLN